MKKNLVVIFVAFISVVAVAQDKTNLQSFTPSILFKKGEYEILDFYNLYTQNSSRDRDGNVTMNGERVTFINGIYQFTYGVSNSGRINVGADVYITSVLYDDRDASPFNALLFKNGKYSRLAVTSAGPRIKVNPIESLPNFSVQSAFLFPIAKELETRDGRFTGHDRYTWHTQLFFDKSFGSKFQVFFEMDLLYRFARDKNAQVDFFRTPVTVFASYFPAPRFTIFTLVQYAPKFQNVTNGFDTQFGLAGRYTQIGLGMKYQYKPKLGLEISYGKFVNSRNDGNGYALNLGIRYIKRK